MKQQSLVTLSLFATVLSAEASPKSRPKPPNIILFLVDDMGWQDTSHPFWNERTPFNDTYRTPAMEQLAAKGVTFTNAYASAVSSPTRTSLMTGMNPAAHRVTNWTIFRNQATDNRRNALVDFPTWNYNGLQPVGAAIENSIEGTTFPELLRAKGYHTIHCGKAHWGVKDTPGADPLNLGFDVNIAGYEGGAPASYLARENFGFDENGVSTNKFAVPGLEKYWGSDLFLTEILTLEAIAAMDSARRLEKPFYLYLSHYAIHTPFDKDDRYYENYRKQGLDDSQARYASLIEGMDKSLGDVMSYLDSTGMADNTVMLFMSDNGGLSRAVRSGTLDSHNKPLNSGKGSAYEGGLRVPMIAYWAEKTPAASRCNVPVDITDFFPSILELAGVDRYKTTQRVDGISFSPLLRRPDRTPKVFKRALTWHFPNRWTDMESPRGNGYGAYSAIQRDGWKLIYYYDHNLTELFNLNEDIGEMCDLSNEPTHQQRKVALAKELTQRLIRDDAQLPTRKEGGFCNYPDGRMK